MYVLFYSCALLTQYFPIIKNKKISYNKYFVFDVKYPVHNIFNKFGFLCCYCFLIIQLIK